MIQIEKKSGNSIQGVLWWIEELRENIKSDYGFNFLTIMVY